MRFGAIFACVLEDTTRLSNRYKKNGQASEKRRNCNSKGARHDSTTHLINKIGTSISPIHESECHLFLLKGFANLSAGMTQSIISSMEVNVFSTTNARMAPAARGLAASEMAHAAPIERPKT